ncbi:MAG: ankyrin repeat domain-containing protein [Treponema sp.]|nr:ankyrin repeat domain-containing protein [Treponema sp.]
MEFTDIWHALKDGTNEDVKYLIEKKGSDVNLKKDEGNTLLHLAAHIGDVELANILISAGADVNIKNNEGFIPLHTVILAKNITNRHIEIAKMLISAGSDINSKDRMGMVPLHFTATKGNLELTKLLVSEGADVNIKDTNSWTPLHSVASGIRDDSDAIEIVKILVSAGIDIKVMTVKGTTSLGLAKQRGNTTLVQYLKSIGVKESGCYVATAIYGSYDCSQVWTLRRFRDNMLAKSLFGRLFIKFYYFLSPKIINSFVKIKWLSEFCRKKLDKFVYKLQIDGYDDSPYND